MGKKKRKKNQTVLGVTFSATFSGRRHGDQTYSPSSPAIGDVSTVFVTTSKTPIVPGIGDGGTGRVWSRRAGDC